MIRKMMALTAAIVVAAVLVSVREVRRSEAASSNSNSVARAVHLTSFHEARVNPVDGPNVLLISVDTLRADHTGVYGYKRGTTPNLNRFAEDARVFERAYSTSTLTPPSMMSLLTGLYPYNHRVRLFFQRIPDTCITLADHMRRAGYQTAGVVSNLCLTDRASGLGARFAFYDDLLDEPKIDRPDLLERRASRTTDAAIAWLAEHRQPNRPFLLWVHYMDPHGPYAAPAGAPQRFDHERPHTIDPQRVSEHVRASGVTDGLTYVDRYDEEIAYTDQEIGRLLDYYAELGLSDASLIVFVADHGERLLDAKESLPMFCHGFDPDEVVIRVPLMIRFNSIMPGRETQPVSIADIMPTVLSIAGLPVPEYLDGRRLDGPVSLRPPYAESGDIGRGGGLQRAFIYPTRKVVVRHGRSNIPREAWAFDLGVDLLDRHRLPVDPAEPSYQVLADIIRAEPDPGGTPVNYAKGEKPVSIHAFAPDADAIRALRALGYVGEGSAN